MIMATEKDAQFAAWVDATDGGFEARWEAFIYDAEPARSKAETRNFANVRDAWVWIDEQAALRGFVQANISDRDEAQRTGRASHRR